MQSKVKVGPATVAGYGATLVGLVASVLVVVFGVDQEQAALVASSVWAIVAFSWTQWGRYTQARDAAKLGRSSWGVENTPSSGTNSVTTFQKGSIVGAHMTTPDPAELGDADALPEYDTTEHPPPDEGDTQSRPGEPS